MASYVTAFSTENGVPKTGLTPAISIWQASDAALTVNAAAMAEVAGGWYRYSFSAKADGVDYVARADGGAGQPSIERYVPVPIPDALGDIVEGALTHRQVMRLLLSVFAAKRSGMKTANTKFRDQADSKDRVDVTLDVNGNVTAITLDLS